MGTITSSANASVKAARKLSRRRDRVATGTFLVESPQVLEEARGHLERVFVSEDADDDARRVVEAARADGVPVMTVTSAVLASLSATVTPRGVVGVARLGESHLDDVLPRTGLAVLCCDMADPGNAGTVVRTADAAGADAVILSDGSVDARNPKAVRASAGSLFHLPVIDGVAAVEAVRAARRHGLHSVAADAHGTVRHTDVDFTLPTMIVLGSEASGLPTDVRNACDTVVRVDMFAGPRQGYTGHAESLNVAATAAVLAFEAVRQRSAAGIGAHANGAA